MSLLWHDIKRYPSFRRDDEGEWSLFDFVDLPRNLALRAADRVFLLPAMPADPTVYLSPHSLTGGSNAAAPERKPTWIKITGRKYMATGANPSTDGATTLTRGDASAAIDITSPTNVTKKRKFVAPTLTTFESVQAAYALPLGIYFSYK
ncbi:hypothetical protein Hanom_Chr17g01527631 [Helianthus anomalus]